MSTPHRRLRFWLLVPAFAAGLICARPAPAAEVAIVLNSLDDSMSLIDTATHREIARVPIGKGPHHLMPTPDGRYLIIGNTLSDDLVFVNPRDGKIIRRVERIADPYQLGFSPDGRWFVVNGNRLNRVDIYHYHDGDFTLAARLPAEKTPSHMAFSADSRTVFVSLQNSDRVMAVDLPTQKVKWFAPVGPLPAGVWVTPAGKVLVAMTGSDYVEALDPKSGREIGRVTTGAGAHNFQAVGDGRHLFLSDRVGDKISVLDERTLKVVDSFPLPGGPDDMELTRDGRELWVTSRWRAHVSVVDMKTRKVEYYIPVGRSPHGIFFYDHAPLR